MSTQARAASLHLRLDGGAAAIVRVEDRLTKRLSFRGDKVH